LGEVRARAAATKPRLETGSGSSREPRTTKQERNLDEPHRAEPRASGVKTERAEEIETKRQDKIAAGQMFAEKTMATVAPGRQPKLEARHGKSDQSSQRKERKGSRQKDKDPVRCNTVP
jgi:hypothetical protein